MSRSIVLLIDGDPDSIEIYSLILDYHGYEVVAARDGHTGLRLALDLSPALVISEVFLPGLDGRNLLAQLRSDTRTARIPVILLDSIPSVSESMPEPGAFVICLTKPCEPSRLLVEVARILGEQVSSVA
jgi:CheY-like chemotaxis protein